MFLFYSPYLYSQLYIPQANLSLQNKTQQQDHVVSTPVLYLEVSGSNLGLETNNPKVGFSQNLQANAQIVP
jgi:hypothetical protein